MLVNIFYIFAILINLPFYWKFADAIDCYQQAPTSVTYATTYNVFTCPASVSQCYKYVCVGNVYFIQKGCLDPHSPTQNCQVIQNQCQSQTGTGACYVCNGNRCNGQMGMANYFVGNGILFMLIFATIYSFIIYI